MFFLKTLLATFFLAACGSRAMAAEQGLLISGTHMSGDQRGEVVIYLAPGAVRIDFERFLATEEEKEGEEQGKEARGRWRIDFCLEKETMWAINLLDKSGWEITRSDMERMRELMAQFRKQLEQLPPAQRAMMESHMERQMPLDVSEEVEPRYELVSGEGFVEPWTTSHYRILSADEGVKTGEIWIASWEELGIEESDFESLTEFASFLDLVSDEVEIYLPLSHGHQGFPVKAVSSRAGEEKAEFRAGEVTRRHFEDQLFELPEDIEIRKPALPPQ